MWEYENIHHQSIKNNSMGKVDLNGRMVFRLLEKLDLAHLSNPWGNFGINYVKRAAESDIWRENRIKFYAMKYR